MFESYSEIFNQGKVLINTYNEVLSKKKAIMDFFNNAEFEEIVFIACGSSYWLSMSACMSFQERIGKKCCAVKSGDIVMNTEYYKKAFNKPLVIAPSRSGSTTETLMALEIFRQTYNCRVISLVEYENSPFTKFSDLVLEFPWANEISVCQTRSFSSLYMASILIASILSNDERLIKDIELYLNEFPSYSKRTEDALRKMILDYPQAKSLVTLGNGKIYGVCIEGAYICIEMAQFPSNYYGTLEFRHGPIVMADSSTIVFIFSSGNNPSLEEKMALEIKEKGAKTAVICEENNFSPADACFSLGRKACPEVVALYGIMVLQGFAHLKALDMGINPDKPKQLVPWIKL